MGNKDIWLFIFFAGVLAFCWPMPAIFAGSLPAYIFTAWLVFIAVVFFFTTRAGGRGEGG